MEKLILHDGEIATLAEYSAIDGAIAELRKTYAGRVYDVTTTGGMKNAKVARAEVKKQRTSLEKIRVAIKKPALERCRLIDSEAKRITAALFEIEKPIDELIRAEEKRKADEIAKRKRIEKERLDKLKADIEGLHFRLSQYHPAVDIQAFIDRLSAIDVELTFDDLAGLARETMENATAEARTALALSISRAKEQEKAEKERAVEAERLAKERAELDAQRRADEKKRSADLVLIESERKAQAAEKAKIDEARLAIEDELSKAAEVKRIAEEEATRVTRELDVVRQAAALMKEEEKKDAILAAEAEWAISEAEAKRNEAWNDLVAGAVLESQDAAMVEIYRLAMLPVTYGVEDVLQQIAAICAANADGC